MTNPFTSNPEASAFWREQQQACEEARLALVKHPVFAAFLAAGGTIDVSPVGIPSHDGYVALFKSGGDILVAVPFMVIGGEITIFGIYERHTVPQLTAWLTEARDGVRYTCPECDRVQRRDEMIDERDFGYDHSCCVGCGNILFDNLHGKDYTNDPKS